MRKTIKKAVILLVIFIAALAVYFIWSSGKDDEGAVYTSIEDANLPVVYMELFGRKMNCLYGFVEDRPTSAGRGDLTGMDAGGNTGKGSASDSEPSVGGERIYDDSGNLDRGASCRILLHPHHVVGKPPHGGYAEPGHGIFR